MAKKIGDKSCQSNFINYLAPFLQSHKIHTCKTANCCTIIVVSKMNLYLLSLQFSKKNILSHLKVKDKGKQMTLENTSHSCRSVENKLFSYHCNFKNR